MPKIKRQKYMELKWWMVFDYFVFYVAYVSARELARAPEWVQRVVCCWAKCVALISFSENLKRVWYLTFDLLTMTVRVHIGVFIVRVRNTRTIFFCIIELVIKIITIFSTNNIYSIYLFPSLIENWGGLQTWFHFLCWKKKTLFPVSISVSVVSCSFWKCLLFVCNIDGADKWDDLMSVWCECVCVCVWTRNWFDRAQIKHRHIIWTRVNYWEWEKEEKVM